MNSLKDLLLLEKDLGIIEGIDGDLNGNGG